MNRICKCENSNQQVVVIGKQIYYRMKISRRNVTEDTNTTDDQPNVYLKRVK
jgi:hypothetical protein